MNARACAALAELVRLEDIKDAWAAEGGTMLGAQFGSVYERYHAAKRAYEQDYLKNVYRAWEAARAALDSPEESPTDLPVNKMTVPPYQHLDLPTGDGRVSVDNASPHLIEVVARRTPVNPGEGLPKV